MGACFLRIQPPAPLPNLTRPARGSLLDGFSRPTRVPHRPPLHALKFPPPVDPYAARPALVSEGLLALLGTEVLPGARQLCHCCGSAAHVIGNTFIGKLTVK